MLDDAAAMVEKVNTDLDPELLSPETAPDLLAAYDLIVRLASYGRAVVAGRIEGSILRGQSSTDHAPVTHRTP